MAAHGKVAIGERMVQNLESSAVSGTQGMDCAPGKVLVTGANGFIGVKVVENLLERGVEGVRCLVRSASRRERLNEVLERYDAGASVELVEGDLLARSACKDAAEGIGTVLHLAAGFEKSFAGAFMNSVLGTRNLIEAFLEVGKPRRFVNVSSFAVYSNLNLRRGQVMDEECPLEDAPQDRFDAYGFAKLKQEELVRAYGIERGLPFVVLRPGAVFGPGKKDLSGRIGFGSLGLFVQVGGRHLVPLSYVDNCAEAIVLAGWKPGIEGETINVVDDDLVTARAFLGAYRKRQGDFRFVRIPYWLGYWFSAVWEDYSKASQGQLPPVFNRRRCTAEWKPKRFSNEKLHTVLGWKQRVSGEEAMSRYLRQFEPEKK